MALTLTSACATKDAFGTESFDELCRALIDLAPTASTRDTEQTRREVADIGQFIDGECLTDD